MRVIGVIQARLSSSRLPGKVLLPLAGRPVLWHVIERLRSAQRVDDVIVATSVAPDDDRLVETCAAWDVATVRGPLDDVLSRFCLAIGRMNAETVVRVPADKPLLDAEAIDELVAVHLEGGADYTTNMGAGWPDDQSCPFGLEVEVASAEALLRANNSACTSADREHVMPYLYRGDHGFKVRRIAARDPFTPLVPRLNLDTPDDYAVIGRIYTALADEGLPLPLERVRAFLQAHPDVVEQNVGVEQRSYR